MKALVNQIILKNKTRDPFEIASNLDIVVLEEPLGSINGYYNKVLGIQFIHINCDLPEVQKRFICAHELGHALLHADFNHYFLNNKTYFNVGKFEKEADLFAVYLLVENIKDYQTINEFIIQFGLSEKIKNYFDWGDKHGIC